MELHFSKYMSELFTFFWEQSTVFWDPKHPVILQNIYGLCNCQRKLSLGKEKGYLETRGCSFEEASGNGECLWYCSHISCGTFKWLNEKEKRLQKQEYNIT